MWIHVPETYSASRPASEASSWPSTQPWLAELARSVTWKTNSASPASLRRVWRTAPSIQRLSGLTCEPSIQSRGVARWISSLGDSRASHTASREASSERTIPESYQEKSSESPTGLDFQTSFLKMSPASSDSTGSPYDPNYERWVTKLRRDSSRRQKQAHLTGENGSSSWPTPRSTEYKNPDQPISRRANTPPPHLSAMARRWPTPNATTHGEGDTNWEERRQRIKEQGINGNGFGLTLGMATTNWPTPQSDSFRSRGGNRKDELGLPRQAKSWQNPDSRSIPQAPTTTPDGHTCSPSCRRLNPRFAEMLMGLPPGWTDDSEPLETESFRQWQHALTSNLARQ